MPMFSPKEIADWLRTQPADTVYDPSDTRDCLMTRFGRTLFGPDFVSGELLDGSDGEIGFGTDEDYETTDAGRRGPLHTYGAALARAERLL